jgi:formylglycine-generating enzyme required for sulfatase activity
MRSGRNTDSERAPQPRVTVVLGLVLASALLALAGCGRKASEPGPDSPTASPPTPAPAANPGPVVGSAGADAADMIQLPGGRFVMGDKNEVDATPHEVVVSAFAIDRHLVSQELFQKVMGSNPSRWKGDKNPVEQVRWSDAVTFCNRRSEREGLQPCYDLKTWQCRFDANGYRLPTEAEWEYACRGGTTTAFFFGDSPARLGDYAWFDRNAGGHPHPAGLKQPNAWGLYDMCGNVWQWCNDFYQVDYYQESPKQDPPGPGAGKTKVVRGGAWRVSAENCRSGYRYNENPGYADVCFGYDIYGFRCVRKATAVVPK